MEIKTLDGISIAEITNVFNAAFADYIVPFSLSESDVASKIKSENIIPGYSTGTFVDGKLVGFILIGSDGIVAYNAGTGVIPDWRGQNLTQKMYDFLLPLLAENGIVQHRLEVIVGNVKAIPVYERIGFATARKVTCFKGKIASVRHHGTTIKPIDFGDITNPQKFWDFVPTYQNTSSVILRMPESYRTLGAYDGDLLVGYVVFATDSLRIKQFGVAKNYRRKGIGHQLFGEVQKSNPDQDVSLINVDSADGSIDFLKKIGLVETVSQFEMHLRCT